MNKSRGFKIFKIVILSLTGLILVSVIAGIIVFNTYVKPKSKAIISAVDELMNDEEFMKDIEPYLEKSEFEQILENVDDETVKEFANEADSYIEKIQSTEEKKEEPSVKNEKNQEKAEAKTEASGKTQSNGQSSQKAEKNNNKPSQKKVKNKEVKKPRKEYKSNYEYVKDNVSPSDFKVGSSLASRVDVGYVLGIVSGGMTSAEKSELKKYLSSRFSPGEISQGIALYSKYSYLLR